MSLLVYDHLGSRSYVGSLSLSLIEREAKAVPLSADAAKYTELLEQPQTTHAIIHEDPKVRDKLQGRRCTAEHQIVLLVTRESGISAEVPSTSDRRRYVLCVRSMAALQRPGVLSCALQLRPEEAQAVVDQRAGSFPNQLHDVFRIYPSGHEYAVSLALLCKLHLLLHALRTESGTVVAVPESPVPADVLAKLAEPWLAQAVPPATLATWRSNTETPQFWRCWNKSEELGVLLKDAGVKALVTAIEAGETATDQFASLVAAAYASLSKTKATTKGSA